MIGERLDGAVEPDAGGGASNVLPDQQHQTGVRGRVESEVEAVRRGRDLQRVVAGRDDRGVQVSCGPGGHGGPEQEPGGAVLADQDAPGQTNGAGTEEDRVVKTVADHAVCPAGAVAQGGMGDVGHEDDHGRHREDNEEPSPAEKSICHGLDDQSACEQV